MIFEIALSVLGMYASIGPVGMQGRLRLRVNPYSVGVGRFDESGNGMAGRTIAMVLTPLHQFLTCLIEYSGVVVWRNLEVGSWKLERCVTVC